MAAITEEVETAEVVGDNVGVVQLQQKLEKKSYTKINAGDVENSVIGETSARKAIKTLKI